MHRRKRQRFGGRRERPRRLAGAARRRPGAQRCRGRLSGSPVTARCLYEGEIARPLAETAPYLVAVQPWDSFTELILDDGWGQSWGIFLSSSAPAPDLRRHLRRFLMVADEEGRSLYFR